MKELSSPFKSYISIPQISVQWARIQTLQGELRTRLDQEFDALLVIFCLSWARLTSISFIADPANPVKPSVISNACLVVDVIGDDFRNHLIDRYCAIELKEYRRVFRITDEAGQLDNLSRRFAFFKRTLSTYDNEHARVFPPEWRVGQHMSAKFIDFTRYVWASTLIRLG